MNFFAIPGMISGILGVIGRLFPDKDLTAKLEDAEFQREFELQLENMLSQQNINLEQIKTNREEQRAGKGGWRTWTGYICASSFGWAYVVQPVFVFFFVLFTGHQPPLPQLDLTTMMPILMGMLGLAGIKGYQQVKGRNW